MDLSQFITISFDTREVVFLDAFFKQCVPRLGQGEFRDAIQKIKEKFDRAVLTSQISNVDSNKVF